MENDKVIICGNCYTENERGSKTCCKCGGALYYNEGIDNKEKTEENIVTNTNTNELENRNNGIAMALKLIAVIEIIAGVILAFMLFEDEFGLGLGILVGAIATGMLIMGIGEIIQLLEDIKNK